MSGRYKINDSFKPHFITSTVVGWADALSRPVYKDIILESLRYCQQHKNLLIHAWVLMNNHIHLIVSAAGNADLSQLSGILKNSQVAGSLRLFLLMPPKAGKNG